MSNDLQRQREDRAIIVDVVAGCGNIWNVPTHLRLAAAEACRLDDVTITENGEVVGRWTLEPSQLR